ncbi:hypothetical protein TTHERM_000620998 (macronuclear) [Tetrahymena thermophila SB210]|uniref:Uncharacterized protein n=1 Tax=Tetrahymena thermophila (strain SB210) TaxID=312017 RepID=W7XBV9_TETTS|nr:hypothetical protein TTHERM_000620998 [Tetrahymena thermophila SB210]EWS73918.1 hypothetical protein TTHERM_000620998 [Tetrahymena thermophila SB210]|eukprot:XP_012653540.1 hypothetical protein TTHERM_000620998 [Tetrahymena thermophila SB210]
MKKMFKNLMKTLQKSFAQEAPAGRLAQIILSRNNMVNFKRSFKLCQNGLLDLIITDKNQLVLLMKIRIYILSNLYYNCFKLPLNNVMLINQIYL